MFPPLLESTKIFCIAQVHSVCLHLGHKIRRYTSQEAIKMEYFRIWKLEYKSRKSNLSLQELILWMITGNREYQLHFIYFRTHFLQPDKLEEIFQLRLIYILYRFQSSPSLLFIKIGSFRKQI